MDRPARYSRLQLVLHWIVFALIVMQYVGHEAMVRSFDAFHEGRVPAPGDQKGAWFHVAVGLAVLLLAVARLALRVTHGVPPLPHRQPAPIRIIAGATHFLLYALLFLMPVTGGVAWFFGIERAGDIHSLLRAVLLGLFALHVAGAFAEQILFKNNSLGRITGME